MREMHWSWYDLLAAPNRLIEEIAVGVQERNHWQHVREERDRQMSEQRRATRG